MVTAQLSLLDEQGRAHRFGHDTEKRAARSIAGESQRLRARVLELLRAHPEGLTDDEGGALMGEGCDRLTFGRRRNELQKAGLVVKTRERRDTPHGRSAIVWQAAR